jgi:hypothetical protein
MQTLTNILKFTQDYDNNNNRLAADATFSVTPRLFSQVWVLFMLIGKKGYMLIIKYVS